MKEWKQACHHNAEGLKSRKATWRLFLSKRECQGLSMCTSPIPITPNPTLKQISCGYLMKDFWEPTGAEGGRILMMGLLLLQTSQRTPCLDTARRGTPSTKKWPLAGHSQLWEKIWGQRPAYLLFFWISVCLFFCHVCICMGVCV